MTKGIFRSRGKTLILVLFLSLFFGVVISQSSFAQEGKYASTQDAMADITYDHVIPVAEGVSSTYSGPAGLAPNFYGGDLGHATSATCGMSFLMKPGYKIKPYNDSKPISSDNISIINADDLSIVDEAGDPTRRITQSGAYYVRATWAVITYVDGSADLVMFGNAEGHPMGPDECGYDGNTACGGDYEWAFSCHNLFSDAIVVDNLERTFSNFPAGSSPDGLAPIGTWQPSNTQGYGNCASSHFHDSFESHATCTMLYKGIYRDSLTAEQKAAAAAAITYEQQTQEEQCGGVVGFFTCPLAESMSNFLKTVYDIFSGFFLNIDPSVFSGNKRGTAGYAIHKAWSSFRDIANAMLVAALLIVILSQISGFGITNYGIKKSLPKIVIAALLVNLSYLICQGAIDLSNIFGHRIGDIFEGMLEASGGPIHSDAFQGSTIATLIFVLIAVVVAIIHFGARIWVALIALLLICAVAMFIMLAVSVIRQALCILAVVVSPVALCCYMIPGTKGVFNKWFGIFKGVLIAYPMTSLVVYGSSYASSILLKAWGFTSEVKADNFFETFLKSIAGLLVVTVPYFFIPRIIMKSLTALEGITSRIGNALIRNTSGAVRGSAFAQRQNDTQEFRRNVRRAGLHYNRRTGTVENRRRPGRNAVTRAFARARDAYYNHPSRAMYARNANAMAAQRRRGRSYLTGDNQLDQILQDRSGDSAELLREKAALRRRLEFNRRMGLSTAGITRRVNRMFGAGGEFESFTPQAFRNAAGDFTGVRSDFETTQENINNSTQNQRTREYIKQIEAQSGLTEEGMSDSIIDAANSGNTELTSAYITVLLGNGEAGRDALLQCLRTNGLSGAALEIIADSVSVAEMNDIKKKDRYLFNRLQAIKRNRAIGAGNMNNDANFRMNCQDIRGMSAKQFSEMDISAQNRLIDEITDPNIYGAGTGYNPEDGIVAAAANLAEEILSDPNLRGTISAERLSNLENIVRIREDAVNQSVHANRAADLAAINGMSTTNAAGQKLVDTTGMDFVNGIAQSSLKTEYENAAKNGDTIRMESIQIAIESKYRENLRNAGVTLSEDAEAMMLATLQEVYTRLNNGDGTPHDEGVDGLGLNDFNGANDDERRLNRDARDGFVDLLNGRMDRRRRNMRR